MAFLFPSGPTVGQRFTPVGGPTYVWTGSTWDATGAAIDLTPYWQNGSTSLEIDGTTSGTITLASPAVAGTNTLTFPAKTATVATEGPLFYAYGGGLDNLSNGVYTKLSYTGTLYNVNSNYDATARRFTPTVPGYYLITLNVAIISNTAGVMFAAIARNGGTAQQAGVVLTSAQALSTTVQAILYMNGTTDYVEPFGVQYFGSNQLVGTNSAVYAFTGAYIRGA